MSDPFELHPRLAADCAHLAELELSTLLLMNDARFPWCILVPRLPGLKDLHDVPRAQWQTLFEEIDAVSRALQSATGAHKLNVAALGNQVSQLHIHVIARATDDAAWPGPVWGVGEPEPYDARNRRRLTDALSRQLRGP